MTQKFRTLRCAIYLGLIVLLGSCVGLPDGVRPAQDFDLSRYLGRWYEIARLDHSFERGLDHVTAEYALRDDGGVSVVNRGYARDKGEWKMAKGKAYFVESESTGYLKVSFFGPFYGSYVVFELDTQDYQYAFVSGPDKTYLWLLARTPTVEPAVMENFQRLSKQLGFDTSQLIFVEHDNQDQTKH